MSMLLHSIGLCFFFNKTKCKILCSVFNCVEEKQIINWGLCDSISIIFREFDSRTNNYQCHGAIINKNKIEDFKSCDKLELINEEGKLIWNDIASGACLEKPSLLSRFFILSFGVSKIDSDEEKQRPKEINQILSIFLQDLKAFHYYYHFAYPCLSTPIFERVDAPQLASDLFGAEQMEQLTKLYLPLSSEDRSFFIIDGSSPSDHSLKYFKLSEKITMSNVANNFNDANLDEIYFCFSDPCSNIEYAGWPLRLFLLMLTHLWYIFTINIILLSASAVAVQEALSLSIFKKNNNKQIINKNKPSIFFQSKFERQNDKNIVTSLEEISIA